MALLVITRFSVDAATWQDFLPTADCDEVEVVNTAAVDVLARTSSGDSTTEYRLAPGDPLQLPLRRWQKGQRSRITPRDLVASFQSTSGTVTLTAFCRDGGRN